MKKVMLLSLFSVIFIAVSAQKLVIRMDDIGATHSENLAVIKCYVEGIGTSAEVMTVCPWFLEAATMLNQNPGLDVGIHIAFNSEWANYKWRPLTNCPSLCDADGYLSAGMGSEKPFDLKEAEAEMRAQIALGVKYIKNVTHITNHMGWSNKPGMKEIAVRVAKEFGLRFQGNAEIDKELDGLSRLPMFRPDANGKRESVFIDILSKLEKGKTYWMLEHPGIDNEEMKGIYLKDPSQNVGGDRQDVTDTFTSPKVMQYIRDHGIELISFGDLIKESSSKDIEGQKKL